jgi:hypothetical protein
MHECRIPGCTSPVRARFSPLCSGHRRTLERHGHPEQAATRAADLAPFLRLVARRQADNPDSPAWAILRARWAALVDSANATLAAVDAGKAYCRIDRIAAERIRGIAGAATADQVIATSFAVVFHQRSAPQAYRDDRSTLFQLARRVLKLAPMSMGRYWNQKTRTMRTAHREIPPRALALIAGKLNEAFAGAAAQLWAIEQSRRPPQEVEAMALTAALESLKA